jgi:hypothetical protein
MRAEVEQLRRLRVERGTLQSAASYEAEGTADKVFRVERLRGRRAMTGSAGASSRSRTARP